ncbi:SMC family ATPase [bacterium]|nr:SMC family ATPase [bacterium]
MTPVCLTIEGFRSYREAVVLDFSGIRRACVIGPNGSGKSSIVMALLWALFGKSSARNNPSLINSKSAGARVELIFDSDNKRFRLIRELKGSRRTASAELAILDNGSPEIIAEGVRDVDNAISRILHMGYDDFISASIFVQGEASRFSTMSPAHRKAFFSKILGISLCEEISRIARSRVREMESEKRARQEEIERLEAEIESFEPSVERLDECRLNYSILKKSSEKAKSELEIINRRKKEIDHLKYKITSGETAIEAIENEIRGLIEEIASDDRRLEDILVKIKDKQAILSKLDDLKDKEKRFAELEIAFVSTAEFRQDLTREEQIIAEWKSDHRNRIALLETKAGGFRGEINKLQRILSREIDLTEKHQEFVAVTKTVESLRRVKKEADHLKNRIIELTANISAEKRRLDDTANNYRKRIEDIQKDILSHKPDELIVEIDVLGKEIIGLRDLEVELESTRALWTEKSSAKAAIEAEIGRLETQIEEESNKVSLIETSGSSECPLCGQPLDDKHRGKVFIDLLAILDSNKRVLILKKKELNKIALALDEIKSRGERLKAKSSSLSELSDKLLQKKATLYSLQKKQKEKTDFEDSLNTVEQALADSDFLPEEREALESLQEQYTRKAVSEEFITSSFEKLDSLRESEYEFLRLPEFKKEAENLQVKFDKIKLSLKKERDNFESCSEVLINISKVDELKHRLAEIAYDKNEHKALKDKLSAVKSLIERLHSIEMVENTAMEIEKRAIRTREKLHSMQIRKKEAEKKNEILMSQMPDSTKFLHEIELVEQKNATIAKDFTACVIELSKAELEVKTLESIKKRLITTDGKLTELLDKERIHRLLATAMGKDGVPAFVISHSLPEIEREADELLALLSSEEMAVHLSPEEDKDDLRLRISDSDGERPYESYSGGESFRVDFALRLALSRFLAKRSSAELSMLIIDEGFGTQDSEGLALLIEALRSVENEFSLILVVTHLESLKEEFDQIVEVRKTTKRGSYLNIYV